MPRFSLRTLLVMATVSGPLLVAIYLRPLAVATFLIAVPTIAAVLTAAVLTPIVGLLAMLQFVRRLRARNPPADRA